MFFSLYGNMVAVDFDNESITTYARDSSSSDVIANRLHMEVLSKMFGIMQQHCVTVRKPAKESKIKS